MSIATIVQDDSFLIQNFVFNFLQCRAPANLVPFMDMYQKPANCINVHEQIRDMNRFWRMQLTALPFATDDLRECLRDNIEVSLWFATMSDYFLPRCIELGLPQPWKLYLNAELPDIVI